MSKRFIVGCLLWALVAVSVITYFTSSSGRNNPGSQGNSQAGNQQALTTEEVAKHNSRDDCWIIISNDVYNVTDFVNLHPGGAERIVSHCGKDATGAFQTQGNTGGSHSSNAMAQLERLKLGSLGTTSGSQPNGSVPGPEESSEETPAIVRQLYPNASILTNEHRDDEQRLTVQVNGRCREIRIRDGAIERDQICEGDD